MDKLTHAARCGRYDRNVTKADTEAFLGALTETVTDALTRGESVPLAGGKLEAKQRPARTGRNPRTGDPVEIPACVVVRFVAGKELKEALNGDRA
ncbi:MULTISPECIES: HU family DNA-binding protein [unclassified Desulfovibrio]|uniref:HU family DNA-binding protein n=1 Tax=unclassified Desulfovibrio TaxID=2593640 RepID=UPI00198009D3|nr:MULTISPECIES: HU family DNA-binding protein [unclassified Desulfovibrio]